MARKTTKKNTLKGERLGWSPLEEVRPVALTSVVIKGEKVSKRSLNIALAPQQNGVSFLIP